MTARNPDPAVHLLALDRLGLPAQEPVALEDTANGGAAAQAAGLPCVAMPDLVAALAGTRSGGSPRSGPAPRRDLPPSRFDAYYP
ncbi:hypothetical protein PSH25_000753 [Micromonospora sp. PSH25]|nr:hypothetical protein [Micromonospora foliorum]